MTNKKLDEMWKFDSDNDRFYYTGVNSTETIMTVWTNLDGDICIDNQTECEDIIIPKFVVGKLYGFT